jgi:hypothetical protein
MRHPIGHSTKFEVFPQFAPRQPTLRKNKRAAKPTHKTDTQFEAHLILPDRTQAHPPPIFTKVSTSVNKFQVLTIAAFKISFCI